MSLIQSFLTWFWNSDIWLPPGIDWKDIESSKNENNISFPNPTELLYYPIPLAVLLTIIRYFVESFILKPWGLWLGIRKPNFANAPEPNQVLETAYGKAGHKTPNQKELQVLAKRTDLTERQIESWFRKRSLVDRPSTLQKFSECGWRCICYTSSFILGLIVLWNADWLWDLNHCWYDYPFQSITLGVRIYYIFGSTFYWSQLITQWFDTRRKDFWQMFFHHILTLCLLAFSWVCNLVRIGSVVLLVHDAADIFLEAAKVTKYSKHTRLSNVIAAIFVVVWISTRLGILSMFIIHSTLIEAPKIVPMFAAYYIFNGMLIALLGLQFFWTYFILRAVYNGIHSQKLEDSRSSDESE